MLLFLLAALASSPEPQVDAIAGEPEDDVFEDPSADLTEEGTVEARDTGEATELLYTQDLSDAELERRFVADLPALGSISVGFADEGRVINSVQMAQDPAWQLVVPENAWGTQETVDAISTIARSLHDRFPEAAPLRINHIGKKEGGYLRPHHTHQSGRDVDLGFFYKDNLTASQVSNRERMSKMDLERNWALVKTAVTSADVEFILVDRKIQRLLYDYALELGEDKDWLDSLFAGASPLLQHARGHRDHFHVRFYAPRSQELGRRVQPILAKRPDENLAFYRVRSGDTLSQIAVRLNSTVSSIQKANHMTSSFLRLHRQLLVPMRGPCTHCPLPAPSVVPPRRLPPELAAMRS